MSFNTFGVHVYRAVGPMRLHAAGIIILHAAARLFLLPSVTLHALGYLYVSSNTG